jgi:Ca2+/H+ antiporter
MKKIQRILAIIGVIILLAMYGSTMIFALSGSEASDGLFKASIACTIIVPVLLYAYTLIYKYLKHRNDIPEEIKEAEKHKKAEADKISKSDSKKANRTSN